MYFVINRNYIYDQYLAVIYSDNIIKTSKATSAFGYNEIKTMKQYSNSSIHARKYQ